MTDDPRRLAVVTGAASGLGRATALRLAREGYRVVASDRTAPAETLAALGDGHRAVALDVSDGDAVRDVLARVEAEDGPISALLNFAGVYNANGRSGKTFLRDMETHEWDVVLGVNARGSFFCVREMSRLRAACPVAHGRIVLVSSVAGQMGSLQGSAAYAASKGAVMALAKTAARELAASGITVNCIAPGAIDTPMNRMSVPEERRGEGYQSLGSIPLGRVGEPEEIAIAASFLVSPEAAFITGATIDINGGALMR